MKCIKNATRRTFLGIASSLTLSSFAGCSGSEEDGGSSSSNEEESSNEGNEGSDQSSDESDEGSEQTNNDSEASSEEETQDVTNRGAGEDILENAGLVIQEDKLVEEDEFNTYIEGIVENTTDEAKDYVEVQARVYDADGNQLDSYIDNTNNLQAGGTWAFEVMVLDPEEMEEYDIAVTDTAI